MRVLTVFAHPDRRSFCGAVLDRFRAGLVEAGHEIEIADLYAERFNPVFGAADGAFFADESVPDDVLARMALPEQIVRWAGGPVRRTLARRWLRNRDLREVARFVHQHRPKDVLREQARVAGADALAFIAPVYWLGFPAMLKGWVERVFTYGFAFQLTADGWNGDVRGRIPLLHHTKALLISTTFFGQDVYDRGLRQAMELLIDSWGFRYPGIRRVEHTYFWSVPSVDPDTRRRYLDEAYRLGHDFAA